MEPVDIVRTLRTCDSDLMSLIKLPERTLLNVKRDDELCNDIDNTIDTASDDVKDLLEQALEAPLALCEQYNDYAWVAAADPTLHVKQFAKNVGKEAQRALDAAHDLPEEKAEEKEAKELAIHEATINLEKSIDQAWVSGCRK